MYDVAECTVGCPARARQRAQRLAEEGRSRVRAGSLLLVSLAFAGAVALSGCSSWGAAACEVQLIFFGAPATGAGWLEIDAKGGAGVHYRPIDEANVPDAARRAFAATKSGPV